jgi:hypothetical protein
MKLLAKCEAKRRKDAGGYGKGWPANYVLRWVKGIEWRLFRNLVESWLANGLRALAMRVQESAVGSGMEQLERRF